MSSFYLASLCLFAVITLSAATCKSYQTNAAALSSIQQHQNYPVDDTYCINLAIRIQTDNDKFSEYHTQDFEAVAKSFLLHLNSTVRSKIDIDCTTRPNVATGDKAVSYSYNCCKDNSNVNDVVCNDPKLIDINGNNGAFHQVISYTSLILSVLVYYCNL